MEQKVENIKIESLAKKMQNNSISTENPATNLLKVPKGTRDRNPHQMRVLEDVFDIIIRCFKRHDAVTIDTPVFELKEVLTGKYGEDSKLIYDLKDQGGELLALRYDLTVPFARYLAMQKIKTIKRYQIGKVYRRDQPAMTRGRYREFFQCDFDIAGEYGLMLPDVECLRIIYEVLTELDLGDFVIKVNHRKLLDGLFAACKVPADKFTSTCSAIDKLDKTPWSDVEHELLNEKGLSQSTVASLGSYVLGMSGSIELVDRLLNDPNLVEQPSARQGLDEMKVLLTYCQLLGISDRVKFNLSLARGLDYYTGLIYEAVLSGFTYHPSQATPTSVATDEGDANANGESKSQKKSKKNKKSKSQQQQPDDEPDESEDILPVGSVAGGGRYDNLVGMFDAKNQRVPCVGFSFGIERLLAIKEALVKKNTNLASSSTLRATDTDVMVIGTHKGLTDKRLEYCRLLWDAKIKATLSHKAQPKLLDQLQYCESTGIPLAIILGDGELARGVVKLRRIADRSEWEVERDQLIVELKKALSTAATTDAY